MRSSSKGSSQRSNSFLNMQRPASGVATRSRLATYGGGVSCADQQPVEGMRTRSMVAQSNQAPKRNSDDELQARPAACPLPAALLSTRTLLAIATRPCSPLAHTTLLDAFTFKRPMPSRAGSRRAGRESKAGGYGEEAASSRRPHERAGCTGPASPKGNFALELKAEMSAAARLLTPRRVFLFFLFLAVLDARFRASQRAQARELKEPKISSFPLSALRGA